MTRNTQDYHVYMIESFNKQVTRFNNVLIKPGTDEKDKKRAATNLYNLLIKKDANGELFIHFLNKPSDKTTNHRKPNITALKTALTHIRTNLGSQKLTNLLDATDATEHNLLEQIFTFFNRCKLLKARRTLVKRFKNLSQFYSEEVIKNMLLQQQNEKSPHAPTFCTLLKQELSQDSNKNTRLLKILKDMGQNSPTKEPDLLNSILCSFNQCKDLPSKQQLVKQFQILSQFSSEETIKFSLSQQRNKEASHPQAFCTLLRIELSNDQSEKNKRLSQFLAVIEQNSPATKPLQPNKATELNGNNSSSPPKRARRKEPQQPPSRPNGQPHPNLNLGANTSSNNRPQKRHLPQQPPSRSHPAGNPKATAKQDSWQKSALELLKKTDDYYNAYLKAFSKAYANVAQPQQPWPPYQHPSVAASMPPHTYPYQAYPFNPMANTWLSHSHPYQAYHGSNPTYQAYHGSNPITYANRAPAQQPWPPYLHPSASASMLPPGHPHQAYLVNQMAYANGAQPQQPWTTYLHPSASASMPPPRHPHQGYLVNRMAYANGAPAQQPAEMRANLSNHSPRVRFTGQNIRRNNVAETAPSTNTECQVTSPKRAFSQIT